MISLLQILKEEIELIPRKSPEERMSKYTQVLIKKIEQYIKNGSKGDLDLSRYSLDKLPDELKSVEGDLNLSNSKIKELPSGLKVKRGLNLMSSEIEKLPNDIQIGEDLYLSNSKIKSLPDNLKIRDNLSIEDTEIEFLPKGLQVGILNIKDTKIEITSIPKDIKVKTLIILKTKQLGDLKKEYNKNPEKFENKIKKMYPGIKGGLYIYF
jgi:hypothetical protein